MVDDVLVGEPSDFPPSTSPLVVPLPGHIRGQLAVGDEDGFQIHVAAPMTVRFTVVSRNTANGTLSVQPKGGAGVVPPPYFSAGRTVVLKLDLAAGDWVFFVSDYVDGGDYDLTVQPDYRLDMAADFWPVTFTSAPGGISPSNPRQVTLPLPAVPPALAGTPGLYARYWVSGQGFVGEVAAVAGCTGEAASSSPPPMPP